MAEEDPSGGSPRSALSLALVVGVHLWLVTRFAPREVLLSAVPMSHDAFALEWYRVGRATLARDLLGSSRAYDPLVAAGAALGPPGALAPRFFWLGVPFLAVLGVEPARAFNVLCLAVHVAIPLIGYAAARALRVPRPGAVVGAALWSALWFFDSTVHVAWHSGRVPWLFASAAAVLGLAVALRALRGGVGWALAGAGVFALAVAAHPLAALPPLVVSAAVALATPGLLPARRLRLVLLHAVPLALLAAFGRGGGEGALEPLATAFQSVPSAFLWDTMDVVGPGRPAESAARTLVRTVSVAACLLACRRPLAKDVPRRAVVALVLFGFLFGYSGGLVHATWPVDPALFVVGATFLAASVAGGFLAELRLGDLYRSGSPTLRAALAVLLFLGIPRAYRTVATYFPELLPARVLRSGMDARVSPLVGNGDPPPARLGHDGVRDATRRVAAFLSEGARSRGRVLVDDAELALLLATETSVPVIGPLVERGSSVAAADPSMLLEERASPELVRRFLERYAIGWVVLGGAPSVFDRDDPALEPPIDVAGHRLRRVVREPSWFLEGGGTVGRAEVGSVTVSGATGARVVLRFHFAEGLACRPSCAVERAPIAGDPAGFVAIVSPPPSFELYLP
ncbi:MAG TPA: hypothetical protein VHE30_09440 [Polyangiaceae bacterium]|nr:hypothetical protein [Polyangiaceae bacterium]